MGTYAPAGSSATIQAPAGTYIPFTGASSAGDAIPAPMGTYAPAGSAFPIPVPAGRYNPYTNATSIADTLLADPGYYVPATGATHETAAEPGYFVSNAGATNETPAGPGYYVPGIGATSAMQASPGYYVSLAASSIEIPASPGTYVPNAGAVAVTVAPAGTYVPNSAATSAIPASPGSYVSTAGATEALPASPGYYVATSGSTAQTPAPAGYFVANSGATAATAAPPGSYSPSTADTAPLPDPTGTWSAPAASAPTPLVLQNVNLVFGQPINHTQLAGNIPVPGTYSYDLGDGAVIAAGNAQTLDITFTPNSSTGWNTVDSDVIVNVSKATPTLTINANGGVMNGSPFSATAQVSGINGIETSSLESVSPIITYHRGSSAAGPILASAPTQIGTYTAVATFAGSADYTGAIQAITYSILSNANRLVFVGTPSSAVAGAKFSTFTVQLQNAYGNIITKGRVAGGMITITGSTSRKLTLRLVHGIAKVRTLSTCVAGVDTLTATDRDATILTGNTRVVVNPAAAAKLVVMNRSTLTASVGAAMISPLTIQIQDRYGNVETSDSSSVLTLSLQSSLAPSQWTGNQMVAVNGIATFADLVFDLPGRYALKARTNQPSVRSAISPFIQVVQG
jgi:hypothetical protein